MTNPIATDEHTRHIDNADYQAAIERAAIQETNETTKEIETKCGILSSLAEKTRSQQQ